MSDGLSTNKPERYPVAAAHAADSLGAAASTAYALLALVGSSFLVSPLTPLILTLGVSANSKQFIYQTLLSVVIVSIVAAVIKAHNVPLAAVGLTKYITFKQVGLAIIMLAAYFATSITFAAVLGALFPSLDIMTQTQKIGYRAGQPIELLIVGLALVVLPPIAEEFVFRGFLFRAYLRQCGYMWAAVVVSGLFALAHLSTTETAEAAVLVCSDMFILSLYLCHVRYKTGSLWPVIMMHSLKNLVAFVFLFIIKTN